MRSVLILSFVLVGCAFEDPLTRPGLWHPTGANDVNLRAMIADPDDLVTGVADTHSDGQLAAAAVARYRAGKVKPLPDSGIAKIAPIAAAGTPTAAPATSVAGE